jgi:hypothetical protein
VTKFLTTPCASCPFRTDIPAYLTPERVREIKHSVLREQKDFPCHKTVDYSNDSAGRWVPERTKRCAGMTILCEKLERPTQMMRIEERLGVYDRRLMHMMAPVFDSFKAMIAAQPTRRPR